MICITLCFDKFIQSNEIHLFYLSDVLDRLKAFHSNEKE